MANYKKRVADRLLERKLKSAGAVLIEGPNGVVRLQLQNRLLQVFCIWVNLRRRSRTSEWQRSNHQCYLRAKHHD